MSFRDSTDFYEKMQKIQSLQHEREAKRLKLEQTLNSYLNSDQRLISLKAQKLQKYWKKICQQERMSKIRNDTILRDVERLEAHLQAMSACTERLKIIRQQYDDYLEKQYPSWRHQIPYISKAVSENKENINDYLNHLHGRKSPQNDIMDHFRESEQTDIKLPTSSPTQHPNQLYRKQDPLKSSQMVKPTNSYSSQTVIPQERPHEEPDYYTKSHLFQQKEHYDYTKPLPHSYVGQSSSHSTVSSSEQQFNQENNLFHQKQKFQQISPIPFAEGDSYKYPYFLENTQISAVRDKRIRPSYSDRNLRYEKYPFLAKKDGPSLFRQVPNVDSKLFQNYYQQVQKPEINDDSGGSRASPQPSEEPDKFNEREIPFNDGHMALYRNGQEKREKMSTYGHEEANSMWSSSNDTLKYASDGTDDYMEQYHQSSSQGSIIDSKIHIHPFAEKTSHYPNRKFKNKPLYTNSENYKQAGELNYRRTDRPFVRFADPPVTQSTPIPRDRDSSSQLSMISTQETTSELSVQSAPPYFQLHAKSSLSDQLQAKPPIHISPARRRHIEDHSRKDHFQDIKPTQTESENLYLASNPVKQRPTPARRTMGNVGNTSQKSDSDVLIKEHDKNINETIEDIPDERGKDDEILQASDLSDQDAKIIEKIDNIHKFTVETLVNELNTRDPEPGLQTTEKIPRERNNNNRDFPAKNQSISEIDHYDKMVSKTTQNEQEISMPTSEMFQNPKNAIEVSISQDRSSQPDLIQIRRSSTDKFGVEKSVSVNVILNPKEQNIKDEVDESLSSEDSLKAALSLDELQDVLPAEQTFTAHLDERPISDEQSDSDEDSLALQKKHLEETESEKSDKENNIEERKGLNVTSGLSQEGLFKLFQAIEEKLADTEETQKFNSSKKPSSEAIENILRVANSDDSLDNFQVEDALMVILQQLPDFIEHLSGCCLFSELLLQQFNIRFTMLDVKNYILSSNQVLWEHLFQHFTVLVKSKILTSDNLANLFGPLLINPNASDFERKKAQLILHTLLEFNEDNDSDLSSATLPSLSQNAIPGNEAEGLDSPEIKHLGTKISSIEPDDSDNSDSSLPLNDSKSSLYEEKEVKNTEKPKKVTNRESDTDDDGDSFFDKVAVQLSATAAYKALLDRTQASKSEPIDTDDDDDIENELAAAVSQQSQPSSSRLASSKDGAIKAVDEDSRRSSKIETNVIYDDYDTDSLRASTGFIFSGLNKSKQSRFQKDKSLVEPRKPSAKVISSVSKPTEQIFRKKTPKVADYLRDSDTDSDVDVLLKGKKEKIVDDGFDFYD